MNEFDLIAKYFQPLSEGKVLFDNDAAVLAIPAGKELVVTSDTLNAGTHFFADGAAGDVARKALRVNISDLYAMGSTPLSYQLNIAFPEKPAEEWLREFTGALLDDQKEFGIFCSGGDTTSINGPLSISITALGLVDKGKAWGRNGAREGEDILVHGTIGDAWIGLQVLRGKLQTEHDDYFIQKYYCPDVSPVSGDVRAAIDVSDGFAADLGHVCRLSGAGCQVSVSDIPFSDEARVLLESGGATAEQLLSGGDDYALILAVPAGHAIEGAVRVGTFTGNEVCILDGNGQKLRLEHTGWSHF